MNACSANGSEGESANDKSRETRRPSRPGPNTGTASPQAGLFAALRREGLEKTLRHQFRLIADPAFRSTPAARHSPPPAFPFARWTRIKTAPQPPRGLAAVKHAQHGDGGHHVKPQRPRRSADRDKEEFIFTATRCAIRSLERPIAAVIPARETCPYLSPAPVYQHSIAR
jgi:hypothetical protein